MLSRASLLLLLLLMVLMSSLLSLVLRSSLRSLVVLTPHLCAGLLDFRLLDFRLPCRPFKQLHINQS
jgi:hypothetical protein